MINPTSSTRPVVRRWPTRIGLLAILLLGIYLRFVGLYSWDQPSYRLHPDERFFTDVASRLQTPASFGEYLDSARNPLNPRNYSQSTWYVYGLLPQTLTHFTAVMLTPNSVLPRCVPRPDVPAPNLNIGKPCSDTADADSQTKLANNSLDVPKLTLLQPLLNREGRDLTDINEIYQVGRTWSMLFDLGSLVLAFLIGKRLYGRRVGLLAALLYALAVLPIQLSHFFTVDAATSFFVLLALYIGVRCAQGGGWLTFAALGLSIGGAMACRVTLATLGLVGVFAVAARVAEARGWGLRFGIDTSPALENRVAPSNQTYPLTRSPVHPFVLFLMLTLAGVLSVVTFRLLQPDAFSGPGFFGLRPEPRFVENIARIGAFISGEADAPPNQQWAGRVPYLFPLQNAVLWGLGLPLGIAALVAWALSGWQLLRRWRLAHLIPWGWVTFYFLWQGGQFVTTMRYYSLLYGVLCVLAAWALVALWKWGRTVTEVAEATKDGRPKTEAGQRRIVFLSSFVFRLSSLIPIGALIAVTLGTALWAFAFTRIYSHPHSRIEASRWIYANIPAGSTITSEEWDDGLPLSLDGKSYNQYTGLSMKPYAEDEPSKYFSHTDNNGVVQPGLLDQLDQADYLIFSSNRVYDSTKRLPMKYPALTRYWNGLFTGKLGFALVADIHSYPTLFGIEIPTPILAEEAFSVYDHPRVLIFKKTATYTRANAEQVITSGVAWDEVYKVTSFVGNKAPTALRLTDDQWNLYRNRAATLLPSLAGSLAPWLIWLVVLELIGAAAFFLLFHLLPGLADRGFALAKTLGLLVVAWLAWWLASIGASGGKPLLAFSPLSVWLCALLLIVLGALVGWRSRRQLAAFWRAQRTALMTAETLFLLAFFVFLVIRALNPDLWHDARGGEKPMDLAYLTATVKSPAFPPYDPWFAGGYINYYYFGFVLIGTLIHLTGVVPTVAYNLAVPTVFALTAMGAFGVAFNLVGARRQGRGDWLHPVTRKPRNAVIAGLLAALFVTTLGPLTQALWLLPGTQNTADVASATPCRDVLAYAPATSYAAQQACRGRSEWAFWDATRLIGMTISQRTGGNDSTISEFPFFTFLFGDLHAHMLALPLSVTTLGLLVAIAKSKVQKRIVAKQKATRLPSLPYTASLLLFALLLGALSATNTWDYPTYLGLGVLTLGVLAWRRWRGGAALWREVLLWAGAAAALVIGSRLLFYPFSHSFATDYAGFTLWDGERTGATEFLKINGLWLFLLLSGALVYYWRRGTSLLTLVLVGAAAVAISFAVAWREFTALWLIIPMLGAAIGVLLAMLFQRKRGEPRPSVGTILPVLWACAALGLCFVSEILVAKGDIGRMNTVFKLGMQSWTLFGLTAALAMIELFLPQSRERKHVATRASVPAVAIVFVRVVSVLLILAAMVYPLTATPARIADRMDPQIAPTLDGTAYMNSPNAHWAENGITVTFTEDANALEWMRRNIKGAPVVLEAQSEGYRWAGRVSIYTGLPTLLGWPFHQSQQRSVTNVQPVLDSRRNLVQRLYSDTDQQTTLESLRKYGVEYVYVGQLEQALYGTSGLAKFSQMAAAGTLEQVYSNGQTRIYRVPNPQNPPAILTTSLPVVAPSLPKTQVAMLDRPVGQLPAVNEYAWNALAQSQPVAIALWLLVWVALALLGLPIALLVFRRWHDGGITFAPLIGLLLLGYAVWLPVSARLWSYDLRGVGIGVLLVLLLDTLALALLGRAVRNAGTTRFFSYVRNGISWLAQHLRSNLRQVALISGLWLLGFLVLAYIRTLNPDLWQPSWGGEKPFEFGFLNALLRSPVMPPYNPFYSDGTINYYYYGLYLMSLPIKLTGIVPAIGFNLALASLFALTVTGAFSIVRQLTGSVRSGLVGMLFVTVLGNLAAVFVSSGSSSAGIAPVIAALKQGLSSFGPILGDWFIGPSRVIPFTINEFPFWSFLFADLHPHLIALPVTLLAVGVAVTIVDERRKTNDESNKLRMPNLRLSSSVFRLPVLALAALTLGTLAVTNSWDFPTYALVLAASLVGAAWLNRRNEGASLVGRVVLALLLAGATAGAGLLLYLPFFQNFKAMVSGIGLVRGGTMPESYAAIYGLFLLILLPMLVAGLWRLASVATQRIERSGTALPKGAMGIVAPRAAPTQAIPLAVLGLLGVGVLLAAVGHESPLMLKLALGAALLACLVLLLNRRIAPATWFALAMLALGLAVSIGIDTIYIRDHLAGDLAHPGDYYRMNTVFKFGVQIWVLFALAAAALLPVLLRGLRRFNPFVEVGYAALVIVVAAFALVYPLAGTPSRVAYRFPVSPAPTLDGLAFLATGAYEWNGNPISLKDDGAAIRWLNANISGTPVVMQSSMEFYRAYGVRVAANTGLPTIVSPLHESEQRDGQLVMARDQDVIDFYRTTDADTALRILSKYQVGYVVVGPIERAGYGEAGIAKFAQLEGQFLTKAYSNASVTIYTVNQNVRALPSSSIDPSDQVVVQPQPQPKPQPPASNPAAANPPGKPTLAELEAQNAANPTVAGIAFGLGERYRDLGRIDDAINLLGTAAMANPNDVPLHHLWGDTLRDAGRSEEAIAAYTQATRAQPTASNYNKLGSELLRLGELDKAETALNAAVQADPQATAPLFYLGQLYAQQGKTDQARTSFNQYLKLAPDGEFSKAARDALARLG